MNSYDLVQNGSKNKTIASIVIKFLIFVSMVVGILATLLGNSFMTTQSFLFFTVQSNIWIGVWCLFFAIMQVVCLCKRKNYFRRWMYVIKYMFTTSITLTFVVMSAMLTPTFIQQGMGKSLLSLSNIFPHYVVPILAIVDFILFDTSWETKKADFLFATIMPIYYLIFALILGACGVQFSQDGDTFPYFFLDYDGMGWFNWFNPNGKYGVFTLGVFWWIVILTAFVIGMGILYLFVQRKMSKTKLASIPFVYEW